MSDHDLDDELRRRLRAATSVPATTGHDLDRLRPRFERARKRRQAAIGGAGTLAAAVLVVGAVLASGGPTDQKVSVAGEPTASTSTSASVSTTTVPVSTVPTVAPATTVPVPPDTTPATVPASTPTTADAPGTTAPRSSTTTPTTPTAPPATTVAPGGTQVASSEGGTATLTWSATSLVVDRTEPAVGWTLEGVERKEATRVVIKFRRDDGGPGSSSASIDARVRNGLLEIN